MCGVVATYGGDPALVEQAVRSLAHRGPDASGVSTHAPITLGHTRLAILDLDDRSNQPFTYGDVTISYNGELWNYEAIRADLIAAGCSIVTTGDTEIVAASIALWGQDAIKRFEGMFAIAWTVRDDERLFLVRDRFGEVPLHIARQFPFWAASEMRALHLAGVHPQSIDLLPPGVLMTVSAAGIESRQWYAPNPDARSADTLEVTAQRVRDLVRQGAQERRIADVPVCVLLSGGIDSAAVAASLVEIMPNLVAYTAVMNPRSSDLRAARETAQALGIELREVTIPEPSLDDLATVIQTIEQPFKAQIEIGWACLHLARQIAADGYRVTYSGEGSDELWASYGFAYHGIQQHGWYDYRRDLFLDQARKNFVRCNKIFMAASVECRLPFLSTPLVEYALSLSPDAVQDGKSRPKAVMQEAFRDALPDRVINRPKVAFQDGLGIKESISARYPGVRRFYQTEYHRVLSGRYLQGVPA